MKIHAVALLSILPSGVLAFQPASRSTSQNVLSFSNTARRAVAVESTDPVLKFPNLGSDKEQEQKTGATNVDLDGVVASGLKYQALSIRSEDFPQSKDLRAVIPADCFESDTATSLAYLGVSLVGTAACTLFGVNMLSVLPPENLLTLPFWALYSAVTGTVAMGLWVLAHECGHGAFSSNRKLRDAIGYTLHSIMLVPYYSWQRSHAVHHQYTNHMELGETHVPEKIAEGEKGSMEFRESLLKTFGRETGIKVWGGIQMFLHLVIGWPGYLLIGATGGPDRGMTNHFFPDPLTTPPQPKKELFPGNWKEKVLASDIGIAATVAAVAVWTLCNGLPQMMAMYGGPLLVINAWLVLYTWLQHTDVDIPHFSSDDHTFVKGALHTVDRPYDKLDPWGFIDFLHHKIGSTHVAHHFDSTIPFYKAQAATDAIKTNFPELYLYDPTPIPEALWRICKGCAAVEKKGDSWVWNNKGLEDLI